MELNMTTMIHTPLRFPSPGCTNCPRSAEHQIEFPDDEGVFYFCPEHFALAFPLLDDLLKDEEG